MTDNSEHDASRVAALRELERQRRLADQLLTMHAALRDRDQRIAKLLVCTVLIASIVGVAFAFAGTSFTLTLLGVTATRSTWLGWLAIATSAMSLVDLVLDKRGAAQARADAVRALAALKAEYRTPPPAGSEEPAAARMSERYAQAMETIPAIPEKSFNRLKAAHLRKVEVSKTLSEHPGMSHRRAVRLVKARYGKIDSKNLTTAGPQR